MPERDGHRIIGNLPDSYTDYEFTSQAPSPHPSNREFDIYHVRRVVAGNPNTPKQVLASLAEDELTNIRRRVAENPRTTPEILTKLAQDVDC
ncbi:MAG: hypothetical protein HY711_10820, partial [Candidatus Melainabacteria bacterium]|nr:hypothetical protein [Candidatus Melainabacteria bacterium]